MNKRSKKMEALLARHAEMSTSHIEHNMRMTKLEDYASGTGKWSNVSPDDVERWMREECDFYPVEFSLIADDLQEMDKSLVNNEITPNIADYVDDILGETSESLYRDFSSLCEIAPDIDKKLGGTNWAERLKDAMYGVVTPEEEERIDQAKLDRVNEELKHEIEEMEKEREAREKEEMEGRHRRNRGRSYSLGD